MSYPFNLSLVGEFQDAYLYKGRLYLLSLESDLVVVNWERLVRSLPATQDKFVYEWSFLRNDVIGSKPLLDMFRDEDAQAFLAGKLLSTSNVEMHLEPEHWQRFVEDQFFVGVDDVTDLVLYRDALYLASIRGIFGDRLAESRPSRLSIHRNRMSDAPVVGLSARYGTLAAACCEEGLLCYSDLRSDRAGVEQYHGDRFVRTNAWLQSDFLTLEDQAVGYVVNRSSRPTEGTVRGAPATDGLFDEGDEDNERVIQFGADYISQAKLLPGIQSSSMVPRTIFARKAQAFICLQREGRHEVMAWRRPRQGETLLQKGLVPIEQPFPGVYTDVFSGGAIDANVVVLDTDQGTAVVERGKEPYFVADDMNVNMRLFPESRWYTRLVCSVKEPELVVTSVWPLDPLEVLNRHDQ